MKNPIQRSIWARKKFLATLLLVSTAISLTVWQCTPNSSGIGLPQDVLNKNPLTEAQFAQWFVNDSITENGIVEPANSVAFSPNSNSSFYQWSAQMFLWITSGANGSGSGSNSVMESPVFYTVTPADSNGNRSLIPHVPGTPLNAVGNIKELNFKKFVTSNQGKRFELESRSEQKVVFDGTGKKVAVSKIIAKSGGGHTFIDQQGKEIIKPKAIFKTNKVNKNLVAKFKSVSGRLVFIDADGNEIESEEGQASGNALISKNNSLVYYITMVNDMYVQFLLAAKSSNRGTWVDTFPTTTRNMDSIRAFARSNGLNSLPVDSNALAMELKTSWVTAQSLGKDSVNYVRITATIPTYNNSGDTTWTVNGSQTTRLALVGMHVVGSAQGHPEMIWATFEHINNTPNASYHYIDSNNNVKTVPQDTGSHWVFSTNGSDPAPNLSHISANGSTLTADVNGAPKFVFTISPSNTLRINPFGSIDSISPNPNNTAASSNSEVIALNNSIRKMLPGNDIRKNYMLIGATWTSGQAVPSGNSYPHSVPNIDSTQGNKGDSIPGIAANTLAVGTSQLANSTMETYVLPVNPVDPNNTFGNNMSCFACHNGSLNPNEPGGALTHVFSEITPPIGLFYQLNRNKIPGINKK